MVDYDVVAIGGSPAGLYTAVAATYLKARVALVASPLLGSTWSESGSKCSKAFTQVGRVAHQMREASSFGVFWDSGPESVGIDVGVRFAEALKWAKSVVSALDEQHSPAVLASLGVDVIFGEGEFCRKPHFAFVVNGQPLRSRTYSIATGSRPVIPDIDGLQSTGYLTPDTIWQQTNTNLPKSLIFIGGDPVGIELAQTFARLGSRVTLVVNSPHILTKEDPEAARLIQAQLEAEGVRVLTGHPVTQVKWIDDRKWIQAGDRAIEADEIVVTVGQQPNVDSLNLEGVGVKFDRHGIRVNQMLQTTNHRIYACGDVLGGYRFAHVANYEARIALKNMLFFPFFKVDYRHIPWAIFSDPELARVGLTEEQAKRRYGDDVFVLRRFFKAVDKAQMRGETTGFCKILVLKSGEILGVHLVGPQASELIHVFSLAMQERIKINAIANLSTIFPSLSEINSQTAADWGHLRLDRNPSMQDFLENFFNFRRSWSR
ncbi:MULTISPECIES: dihydrolipoyl dehydrogenase family protein [Aerosakkonema]|uniref:dihydrolipoyl dehydrogenase family protein n=1 Tax=Aerosakkonema TaxID=1246629 RepID=UPI0035B80E7A